MKMTRKNQCNSTTSGGVSTMRYLTMIVALAPTVGAFSGVKTSSRPTAKIGSGYSNSRTDRRKFSSSRLNYVGANPDHVAQHTTNEGSTWWTSIFGGVESSAADEYLEFLDKRYNRILNDDEDNQPSKGFSVMNWISQGTTEELAPQKSREEDALYVLGVASLASKKFLQKHHMPTPEGVGTEKTKTVIEAEDAEIVEKRVTPVPIAAVVAVLKGVALRRERFVQRQNKSLRMAVVSVMKSVVTSPKRAAKGVQKLFIMGGGERNLAITFLAAFAAMTFFLRPLLKVAVQEGANMMGP